LPIECAAQFVASQRIHWEVAPRSQHYVESVEMILCKDRVDRTGFLAQKLVGLLFRTINVDDSVHALLEYSRAAIPHVCAVVVVAEEDRPGGVFPGADCKIVGAKDLPSMFVPLGPICRAGTIAVF